MDIERIAAIRIAPVTQSYDARDAMLYALGIGHGADPLDTGDLRFVYERDLRCSPAFANVLCDGGFGVRDERWGLDWVNLLHAEQDFRLHRPLQPAGTLRGEHLVIGTEDKGAGRGALLHLEKRLYDSADEVLVATIRSTMFLRGDGGGGGFGARMPPAEPLPDAPPDRILEIATLPRQALTYRLSGDWNPLHVDPDFAREAGFERPILHGLCTAGIACRAILAACCENDPARFGRMFVRFSKPVFPGETLLLELHQIAGGVRFRAIAKERGAVVLDRGTAEFA